MSVGFFPSYNAYLRHKIQYFRENLDVYHQYL